MKTIKELFKHTDLKMATLVVLVCIYIGVMASFREVDAVTELVGYEPAISITIKDGAAQEKNYLVKRTTVATALSDLDIILNEEDTTSLGLDAEVVEGDIIEITRVTYEEEREEENIPFDVVYLDSSDPDLIGTRITSQGEYGTKDIIYKKKLVNGQEVERTQVGEEITKEPVNKVIEEGTVSSGVVFTGSLTRYGVDCAGCGNRTAAGLYVTLNGVKDEGKVTLTYNGGEYYVLAADRSIPFGTIVKVSNHNYSIPDPFYGIVLDRGGAVTGTSMDVFCGSGRNGFFSGGTSYSTQFEIIAMGSGATGIY